MDDSSQLIKGLYKKNLLLKKYGCYCLFVSSTDM
ncbi:hypothetical protein I580_00614 [Enterococcus caccae ATCC BAA-1240]|uniref:Uncharacterized protein n=1 Tax=Enterococcus caccae ATCC BAA-1240 TaxID=1158612 RepID=R3TPB6_9ENTE|nr:hypothetical protein UC7_02698 [Enterococcus caccae ATCC BAA-1240]EOT68231.1 hypothetical protein I580_00614 [Enterococcus caccae ATCC BAA-1240]